MSAIDECVKNNDAFAEGFDKGDLPLPPAKKGRDRCLHPSDQGKSLHPQDG